jgi:serine/threonine protein kinase
MDTQKNDIMQFESILPADFDGTFRFTNWTDEDFVGKWGNKEYHFPAGTTSPIVIYDQTPLEIQQIRKKFAKDLAEREFYKTETYKSFLKRERNDDGTPRANGIHGGMAYSETDIKDLIQKCLAPLPSSRATVTTVVAEPLESKLSRNNDGELNTEVIDRKTSLKEKALRA